MIHCNHQKEIFGKATSQSVLTGNVSDAYGTRTEENVRENVLADYAKYQTKNT